MVKSKKESAPKSPLVGGDSLNELPMHVVHLIEASMNADYSEVRRLGSYLTKDLVLLGYEDEAKRISSFLRKKGVPLQASGQLEMLPVDMRSKLPLIEEMPWPTTPLFLNEEASETFARIITDAQNSHQLSQAGISSALCLLLMGPPGTGKTLLAGQVAAQLGRPFYVVRLDSLISSLLGDTAKNIRSVFDFIPHKKAVLLIDEIDAVAKMRDDKHELGEIKRVVNTLIQGLDSIDDQTVVIGATNHTHLLDPAIWRRFPYKIELSNPEASVREAMWGHFLLNDTDIDGISGPLALLSDGMSGAEIQEVALSARRKVILEKKPLSVEDIASSVFKRFQSKLPSKGSFSSKEDERKFFAHLMCIDKKITQVDAAKFLGVTRQTIANYLKESSNGE